MLDWTQRRPDRFPSSTRAGANDEPPGSDRDQLERAGSEIADFKAFAPAFYRGIPASEVVRAVDELGFGGIIEMDVPL